MQTPDKLFPQTDAHRHDGVTSRQVSWNDLDRVYFYKVQFDPPSLSSGSSAIVNFTTAGVVFGDYVLVAAPYSLRGIRASGYVQAVGSTSIVLYNGSTGVVDLASGSWTIKILKAL